jgi:hypothetical protein
MACAGGRDLQAIGLPRRQREFLLRDTVTGIAETEPEVRKLLGPVRKISIGQRDGRYGGRSGDKQEVGQAGQQRSPRGFPESMAETARQRRRGQKAGLRDEHNRSSR